MARTTKLTAKQQAAVSAAKARQVIGTKKEVAHLADIRAAGRLPQTRAGQEAWVREQKMVCLGPFRKEYDPTDTREKINLLRSKGKLAEASALSLASRKACGYDMSEVFAKGPLDGEEHPYECPKCGVTGTYRTAHFNEEPDA